MYGREVAIRRPITSFYDDRFILPVRPTTVVFRPECLLQAMYDDNSCLDHFNGQGRGIMTILGKTMKHLDHVRARVRWMVQFKERGRITDNVWYLVDGCICVPSDDTYVRLVRKIPDEPVEFRFPLVLPRRFIRRGGLVKEFRV